ncbi:hypothetical protein EDB92DRAFT_1818665 [Lactarius akahatsu]|uniref:Uncharacterized protein n=1 Tax=Lactarius akahatsu TaxID=416441 RepID=A0AAD4L9C0_9AGAM|nr:hypothetical protein EDB92DRAFT_1818665 [Lactarius akahatsu]
MRVSCFLGFGCGFQQVAWVLQGCGVETALMGWGRDRVTRWAVPASRWWWGLCRDDVGAGRAGSRWQWGLGQDGAGAGRVGSGGCVEVGAAWQGRGGHCSWVGRVEGVAAMSRWQGRGAAGAGGGVEGAVKSLQEREVLPNRNG